MSKLVIVCLCALLLAGLVAAVLFGEATNWGKPEEGDDVTASTKAVQSVCQPTDYKEACFNSMSNVDSDDPKELVKAAFESAKIEITTNVGRSKVLRELERNPETAEAVKECRELFQDCVDDLERSYNEIGSFEMAKMNEVLGNLKSWLSASITYQETCLDGFENTTSDDAGGKVRKLLQTSMELSSNGLAIVGELATHFGSIDFASGDRRRRLLNVPIDRSSRVMDHEERKHIWLDEIAKNRRLLQDSDVTSLDKSLVPEEEGGCRRRRHLNTNNNDAAINLTEDLKTRANVVVAQNGGGKYKRIKDALKSVPKNSKDPYIMYIKEGVYNESLLVQKWMKHLVFVGDGPTKTRITNNKNFADGTKIFKTATLSVLGDFFMAKDIGIENSAGALKHQAVALLVQSDQSIFFNCHMDGYQGTLYTHTYRQFYRDCQITGAIDFIFGDAASFFQNCTLVVRKPPDSNQRGIVTAQGRIDRHQPTGIIIHRSRFEGDNKEYKPKDKNKAFLGRPWKEYSKTIIMESFIGKIIASQGWVSWQGNFGLDTCYYGEYMNEGPGSRTTKRVTWRGVKTIGHTRAEKFMPHLLFETDAWIVDSGVPYEPNLFAPAPESHKDKDSDAPTSQPPKEEKSSSGSTKSKKKHSSKSSSKGSSKDHGNSSSSGSTSTPPPNPAPASIGSQQVQTQVQTSNSTTTLDQIHQQNKIGVVSMKELERMLMENGEIEEGEEEPDNDMSDNVLDDDEPSQLPGPGPESSGSISSPSNSEVGVWLPPATAPEPSDDEVADSVLFESPSPKLSLAFKYKYEFSVILTGLTILASLLM